MLINNLLDREDFSNHIYILNNFPDDFQSRAVDIILEKLKEKYKSNLVVERIFDKSNIKSIIEFINSMSLFSDDTIIFYYNFSDDVKKFEKVVIPDSLKIFVFTNFKKLESVKNIKQLEYPSNINPMAYINNFFKSANLLFDDNSTKIYLASFFDQNSLALEQICENISAYVKSQKLNIVNKEIINQFISFSPSLSIYSIFNAFFKKDRLSFYHQYIQFLQESNDFLSFLIPFIKEVKTLALISSIENQNSFSSTYAKTKNGDTNIISYLKKCQLNYNPYKLQYDKQKLANFENVKILELFEFLLSVDIYSRYYDKNAARLFFEIGITQFI